MFKTFLSFLTNIPAYLGRMLSSKQFKKAQEYSAQIGALLQFAMPAFEFVAKMTPNRSDDEIVALLNQLMLPMDFDSSKPLSDFTKRGLLLGAAGAVLKGHLTDAIMESAGAGILLGGSYFRTVEQIPDNWIDSAVQNAFGFTKNVLQAKS